MASSSSSWRGPSSPQHERQKGRPVMPVARHNHLCLPADSRPPRAIRAVLQAPPAGQRASASLLAELRPAACLPACLGCQQAGPGPARGNAGPAPHGPAEPPGPAAGICMQPDAHAYAYSAQNDASLATPHSAVQPNAPPQHCRTTAAHPKPTDSPHVGVRPIEWNM